MKSLAWLSLVMLLGTATGVAAQPYGPYGPGPFRYDDRPGALPYGGGPGDAWASPRPAPIEPSPMGRATTRPTPVGPEQPALVAPPSSGQVARMDLRTAGNPVQQANATLKEGMDKLLQYLAQPEAPNRLQVAAFLDREIAPYFDFDYMAQWVAGPAYGRMTADEKQALAARLEADFLGTLARHLAGYQGQQVRLLPPRIGPRGAVSINAAILGSGRHPSTLQFRMYRSDGRWRVYDVVADGQSAAAYYRVQFQQGAGPGAALAP